MLSAPEVIDTSRERRFRWWIAPTVATCLWSVIGPLLVLLAGIRAIPVTNILGTECISGPDPVLEGVTLICGPGPSPLDYLVWLAPALLVGLGLVALLLAWIRGEKDNGTGGLVWSAVSLVAMIASPLVLALTV